MVVKRQCSFCADEIEPGTGMMFVKRDGTVFYFCSSSCRKQQLHLGRVGHRLKWTRAYTIKRAAEQSRQGAARAATTADKGQPSGSGPSPSKRAGRAKPSKPLPPAAPKAESTEPAPSPKPAAKEPKAAPAKGTKTKGRPAKSASEEKKSGG